MSAWTQLFESGPALILLAALLIPQGAVAAPYDLGTTDLEYYPVADSTGCYYNFQHYDEGDRIITNEPCLNCTCHNRMLMCYLRVCPFTKAIGQDCKVEKRADQCCPVITCPEVPVQLLPSTTQSSTAVGHLDAYGCSIDGLFYTDGARVPSDPNKPCELCYCIRNRTACVMQQCTLEVEGCKPVYQEGVCCPVRYNCEHPDYNLLETTTRRLITTTTSAPTTTLAGPVDCIYENEVFADGALIIKDKPCERCYCMKGDIICAVQKCNPTPLDKVNCTALPPKEGQCCPETYECDHMIEEELTTELAYTTAPAITSGLTTIRPRIDSEPEEAGLTTLSYESEKEATKIDEEATVPSVPKEGEVVQKPVSETPKEQPEQEDHEKPLEEGVTPAVQEIPQGTESTVQETEPSVSQEEHTTSPEISHTTLKTAATEIPDQELNEILGEPEISTARPHISDEAEVVQTDETGYTSHPPKEHETEGQAQVTEPVETESKSTEQPEKQVTEIVTTSSYPEIQKASEGKTSQEPATEGPDVTVSSVDTSPKETTETIDKHVTQPEEVQSPETVSTEIPPQKSSPSEEEPFEPQHVPIHDDEGGEEEEEEEEEKLSEQSTTKPETEETRRTETPLEHVTPKKEETSDHPQVIEHVTEVAPEIGSGLPHEMEVEHETTQLPFEEQPKDIRKEESPHLPVTEVPEYTTKEQEKDESKGTETISETSVTEQPHQEQTTVSSEKLPQEESETSPEAHTTEQTVVTPEGIIRDSGETKMPQHSLDDTTLVPTAGYPQTAVSEEGELPIQTSEGTESPKETATTLSEVDTSTDKPKYHEEGEKGTELPKEITTQVPVAEKESTELPIHEEHPTEAPVELGESTEVTKLESEESSTKPSETSITPLESTELPKVDISESGHTEVSKEQYTEKPAVEGTEPSQISTGTQSSKDYSDEQTEPAPENVTQEQPGLPEKETSPGYEKTEQPIEKLTPTEKEAETTEKPEITEIPEGQVPEKETDHTPVHITESSIMTETTNALAEGTTKEYSHGEPITLVPSEEGKITYTPQPEESKSTARPQESEGTGVMEEEVTEAAPITEVPKKPSTAEDQPEYTTGGILEETTKYAEEPSIVEGEVTHTYPVEPDRETEKPEIGEKLVPKEPITEIGEVMTTSTPLSEKEPEQPVEIVKPTEQSIAEYTTRIPTEESGSITEKHIPSEEVLEGETTTVPIIQEAHQKDEVTTFKYTPQEEEGMRTTEPPQVSEEDKKSHDVTEQPEEISGDQETKAPEPVTTLPGVYTEASSEKSPESEKTKEPIPTTTPYLEEDNEVTEQPVYGTPVYDGSEYPDTEKEEEHGIPGEGNCLVDGQTYKNNSNVPPINHCQLSCKCVSSILQCESVTCTPPPSDLQHCMPVYQGPESCCPTYSCTVPAVTSMESDSHKVETTTKGVIPDEIDVNVVIPSEQGTVRPEVTTSSGRDGTELPEFTLPEERIPQTSAPGQVTDIPKIYEHETPSERIPEITTIKPDHHVPDDKEVETITEHVTEPEQVTVTTQKQTTLQPAHEPEVQATEYPSGVGHDEIPSEEENIIHDYEEPVPPTHSPEVPVETVTQSAEGSQTTAIPLETASGDHITEKAFTESQPQITERIPETVESEKITETPEIDSSKETPSVEHTTIKEPESFSEKTTVKPDETSESIKQQPEFVEDKTQVPQVTEGEPEEAVTEIFKEATTSEKESSVFITTSAPKETVTESIPETVTEIEKKTIKPIIIPETTEIVTESEKEVTTKVPEEFVEITTEPKKEYTAEEETETEGVKEESPETETKHTGDRKEDSEIPTQPTVTVSQESSTEEVKEHLPHFDGGVYPHKEEEYPDEEVTEHPIVSVTQEIATTPESPASSEKLPSQGSETGIGEAVTEPLATEKTPETISHVTEKTEEPLSSSEKLPSQESVTETGEAITQPSATEKTPESISHVTEKTGDTQEGITTPTISKATTQSTEETKRPIPGEESEATTTSAVGGEVEVTSKPDETEVSGKPDETEVGGKPDETEVTGKPYETEVTGKPYETELTGKPGETEVTAKPETEVTGKPDETEVTGKPDETEVTGKPDETEVTKDFVPTPSRDDESGKVPTEKSVDTFTGLPESEGTTLSPEHIPEAHVTESAAVTEKESESTTLRSLSESSTVPVVLEGSTSPPGHVYGSSTSSEGLPEVSEKEGITVSEEGAITTGEEPKVTKKPFIYIPPVYEYDTEREPDISVTTEKEIELGAQTTSSPSTVDKSGSSTEEARREHTTLVPVVTTGQTAEDIAGITKLPDLSETTMVPENQTFRETEPIVTVTAVPAQSFETEAPSQVTEKTPEETKGVISEEEAEIPHRDTVEPEEEHTEKEIVTEPIVIVTAQSVSTEQTTQGIQEESKPSERVPIEAVTEYASKIPTVKSDEMVTELVSSESPMKPSDFVTTVQPSPEVSGVTTMQPSIEGEGVKTAQPSIVDGITTVQPSGEAAEVTTVKRLGGVEPTTIQPSAGVDITTVQPIGEAEKVTTVQSQPPAEGVTMQPSPEGEGVATDSLVKAEITTVQPSETESETMKEAEGITKAKPSGEVDMTTVQSSIGVEGVTTRLPPSEVEAHPSGEDEEVTTMRPSAETEAATEVHPIIRVKVTTLEPRSEGATTTHPLSEVEKETTEQPSIASEGETTAHPLSEVEKETTEQPSVVGEGVTTAVHPASEVEKETTEHPSVVGEGITTVQPSSEGEKETTEQPSVAGEGVTTAAHPESEVEKEATEQPSVVSEGTTTAQPSSEVEKETTEQSSVAGEGVTTPQSSAVHPSSEAEKETPAQASVASEGVTTAQPSSEVEKETTEQPSIAGEGVTKAQPSSEVEKETTEQPSVAGEEVTTAPPSEVHPPSEAEKETPEQPSVVSEGVTTAQPSSEVEKETTEQPSVAGEGVTKAQPSSEAEKETPGQPSVASEGVTTVQPSSIDEKVTLQPTEGSTARPLIPGEGQELPVEQTSESGLQEKPEEAFTSPPITSTPASNASTELYTSGPKEEETTKKYLTGELLTSAPTIPPSSTTPPPQHEIPEEPDYQTPVEDEDYGEDHGAFGPGTCRYGGKVYVSAQQIPRDDPCDFCFCFRSDIICLQQSCPPPIPRCHEEPIRGFCCPRYECPVAMATSVNITTTTTTTTTTLPPHFLSHAYKGRAHRSGCQIQNKAYNVGEEIKSASGPCLHCVCGSNGQMKCDPKACSPEPMLRQMIAVAESRRKR